MAKFIEPLNNFKKILIPQKVDLHQWLLCTPLFMLFHRLSISEFRSATELLIEANDALRFVLCTRRMGYMLHNTDEIVKNCYQICTLTEQEYSEKIYTKIFNCIYTIRSRFGEMQSPIVFILVIDYGLMIKGFCVLIHHSVVDSHSMQLLTNELFHALHSKVNNTSHVIRFSGESYHKYINDFHQSQSYKSLKVTDHDGMFSAKNLDFGLNSSTHIKRLVFDISTPNYQEEFAVTYGCSLTECILSVIVMAYNRSYGLDKLCCEIVNHGRNHKSVAVETQKLIGWLSNTKPIELYAGVSLLDTIEINQKNITNISKTDNSNYECRSHGSISINIIDRSKKTFQYFGQVDRAIKIPSFSNFGDLSHRIYLLGVGILIDRERFTIQLDCSRKNIRHLHIHSFLQSINIFAQKMFKQTNLVAKISQF